MDTVPIEKQMLLKVLEVYCEQNNKYEQSNKNSINFDVENFILLVLFVIFLIINIIKNKKSRIPRISSSIAS